MIDPAAQLFLPQRDYRIHPCRAARRNPARQQCDQSKKRRNRDVGYGIVGLNLEQHAFDQLRRRKRARQTNRQSDRRQQHRLPQDQLQDVGRSRAQRDSNTDFVGALADHVGHNAIDSGHRQAHRQSRENGQQQRAEVRGGDALIDTFA